MMRVKPLPINYSMNARNAGSVLPALKPISISPEPRGSIPIVPHASIAKRNSSIDETTSNIHISNINSNNSNNSNNINNNSQNINNDSTIKAPGNHKWEHLIIIPLLIKNHLFLIRNLHIILNKNKKYIIHLFWISKCEADNAPLKFKRNRFLNPY